VSANQIHQGGKISSAKKRQAFIEWLDEMEYKVFKIPRPDVVLYLSVPLSVSLAMMKERNASAKRNYLGKKKDVHEVDVSFQENSRKSALWLAKTQKNFVKIDCTTKGMISPRFNNSRVSIPLPGPISSTCTFFSAPAASATFSATRELVSRCWPSGAAVVFGRCISI
jgi:hypothetical protein